MNADKQPEEIPIPGKQPDFPEKHIPDIPTKPATEPEIKPTIIPVPEPPNELPKPEDL